MAMVYACSGCGKVFYQAYAQAQYPCPGCGRQATNLRCQEGDWSALNETQRKELVGKWLGGHRRQAWFRSAFARTSPRTRAHRQAGLRNNLRQAQAYRASRKRQAQPHQHSPWAAYLSLWRNIVMYIGR